MEGFTALEGASDVPSRVVGANIAFEWLIYVAGVAAVALAVWFGYRKFLSWGVAGPKGSISLKALLANVAEALSQRRMVHALGPIAIFHILIVIGFIVLLLNSALDAASHLTGWFSLEGSGYIVTSCSADIAGLLLIVGLGGLFVVKYFVRPARQRPVSWRSGALLLALLFAVVTGYLVEGARIAGQMLLTTQPGSLDYEMAASPVGWLVALAIKGMGLDGVLLFHRVIWWVHGLFIMVGIACLPFGRLWHVVAAVVNGAGREAGRPAPIEDYEDESRLGAAHVRDLSWGDLADLDACIECGACSEVCPACRAGYPLSPKQSLILALREARDGNGESAEKDLSGAVGAGALWSCATCAACAEVCPMHIDHLSKVNEIRRRVVLWDEEAPDELQAMFISLEMNQNPWGLGFAARADWVRELNLQDCLVDLSENPAAEVDYVLFAGCFAAYDLSYRRAAASAVRLLHGLGITLGYLGIEEACCGDSARRLGNEYLYESLVAQNKETFERHNVKRLLTLCPHCLNALANEYGVGGDYAMPPVYHITDVLAEVLPVASGTEEVLVQEPCYLVRYNRDHPSTEQVLRQMGVVVRNNGDVYGPTCCGGGGGCMWLDDRTIVKAKRISTARLEDLESRDPSSGESLPIITSCPYCYSMLNDAVSEAESDRHIVDVCTYALEQREGK